MRRSIRCSRSSPPTARPADASVDLGSETTEITIEADAPPQQARAAPSSRHTRPIMRVDDEEPEISIEPSVEPEVEAPTAAAGEDADADEDEPEITMTLTEAPTEIVAIHRAITANDGPHAAGTIDTEPKRRKRSTD